MNMVATLPEPESASRSSTARPQKARPLPLWPRVWHQCTHELRRQRLLGVLMWLLPVVSLMLRSLGVEYHILISYLIGPITLAFTVALVCRCVWASSSSNAERMVHTQPVGRAGLMFGQALFMMVAVVIPWVLQDVVVGLGFGFSGTQWFRLVLGSALMACLPIGLCAAWMSAARTYRQQGIIFTVTLLVWWGAVLLFDKMDSMRLFDWLRSDHGSSIMPLRVHLIGAGLLGIALWVLQSLLHRRRVTMCAALAGVLALAFITLGWPWDWTQADSLPYKGGTLKLSLHGPDTGHQPGMTRLWDGVVVEGLQPREAAVIARFFPRDLRMPTQFSDASDSDRTEYHSGSKRVGVNVDMVRSISNTLPEGWLISDDGNLAPREPLAEVMQFDPRSWSSAIRKNPWLMELAIVQPRLVAEFPLQDIVGRKKDFLLEPGLCVAINGKKGPDDFLRLWMHTVERQPILAKDPSDRRRSYSGGTLARRLYVLLLDDSRKMAHAEVSPPITRNPYATGIPGMTFSTNVRSDTLQVDGPQARIRLTGLTREQWISNVRVQIWWPELKGFHPLQIPGTDLHQPAKEQRK